jgi:hypothetical protein
MSKEPPTSATELPEQNIVNPIDAALPPDQKADQLCALSAKNRPIVDAFIENITSKYRTMSTSNCKLKKSILSKASRPEIRKRKPWFDVEHVRDGLRFRTALDDIHDLPNIIQDLKDSGMSVVKADTAKMLKPNVWGWTAVMYDLRLPDGQLVEYYLTVQEVMDANDKVHHPLYEDWRNRRSLTEEENAQYNQALDKSNEAFEQAWSQYFRRTGHSQSTISAVIAETDKIFR